MISSINGIWMKLDTHVSLATQSQSFATWPEGPQITLKALSLSLLNLYADCARLQVSQNYHQKSRATINQPPDQFALPLSFLFMYYYFWLWWHGFKVLC